MRIEFTTAHGIQQHFEAIPAARKRGLILEARGHDGSQFVTEAGHPAAFETAL